MSNFSETGAVGSSKPTFEQRLDEYFNMPVKTEDNSNDSIWTTRNQGTMAGAGKPSLRDRMAEIGKKISEAHKNRKIEFRKWYMKSKFKKLEKKYKKTYGYANTNRLNDVRNDVENTFFSGVAKKFDTASEIIFTDLTSPVKASRPNLVDIAKGKWSDFKAKIDEAYNAANEEIDSSYEDESEDNSNFSSFGWEEELKGSNYNPLYDDRHNDYDPFNEDPFINDDEEGF